MVLCKIACGILHSGVPGMLVRSFDIASKVRLGAQEGKACRTLEVISICCVMCRLPCRVGDEDSARLRMSKEGALERILIASKGKHALGLTRQDQPGGQPSVIVLWTPSLVNSRDSITVFRKTHCTGSQQMLPLSYDRGLKGFQ